MDRLRKPSAEGTLAALLVANMFAISACAALPGGLSDDRGEVKTGVAYLELECPDQTPSKPEPKPDAGPAQPPPAPDAGPTEPPPAPDAGPAQPPPELDAGPAQPPPELDAGPTQPPTAIAPVDYEITGPGIPRIRGVMAPIPGTNRVSATVSLPTGTNYNVLVSSLVDDGKTDCRTSSLFDIFDSQSTKLDLTLQCDELGAGGPIVEDAGPSGIDGGLDPLADCGVDGAVDTVVIPVGNSVVMLDPTPSKDAGAPVVVPAAASDAGTSTPAKETCAACSQRMCGESQGSRMWADCYLASGNVTAGAAAGTSKSQACSSVMACARTSGCAKASADACYCGEGVTLTSCLTHGATGTCRAVWEAAGESTTPTDLLRENAVWQDTALGIAVRLLSCEASACSAACSAGM